MNQQNFSCDRSILEQLLIADGDLDRQSEIEQHLEHCQTCRDQLQQLAADDELWTQTSNHLSTIKQVELPRRLATKLDASTSFILQTDRGDPYDGAASLPNPSKNLSQRAWMQILDPPLHPETPGRIDEFEVYEKIGQGGMGIVLKGFDRELNRPVAIKVLSPHLASNGTARKRFAREARAAAAVVHPNVVPIYSVNSSPMRPYIVMQLVPGYSLRSLVDKNGPMDAKEIVRISLQIATGLAAAHHQGLIHRDVKPGNVLIERDVSRVMITDFGLAQAVDDAGVTMTGWLAGTPNFMSPEQAQGETLDPRTDLFSLGSLMYFLATGREPFRAPTPYAVIEKIINRQPAHPLELNADIPATLADIIEKLLEKDPKNRFQSATALAESLEQYLAYLQHPNTSRPPKRILTSRRKQKRIWSAAIVAGLFAIVSASYFGPKMFMAQLANGENEQTQPAEPIVDTQSMLPANQQPPSLDSENAGLPMLDPPDSGGRSSAPVSQGQWAAGKFDDAQFRQQLSTISHEVSSLEQRLKNQHPFGDNNLPATSFSDLLSSDFAEKIRQLEFQVNQYPAIVESAGQHIGRDSDAQRRAPSNKPLAPTETLSNPQSQGKLDDD